MSGDGQAPRLALMGAERALHLIAGDVVRFGGLLHIHPKLDHVEEKLQQVLILGIAALHREGHDRPAVLQRHTGGQGRARALAGFDHVVRIDALIQHKTLHALAQAHAAAAGYKSGNPAAAGCYRDHPAVRVRGLNGGGAGHKPLIVAHQPGLLKTPGALRIGIRGDRLPGFEQIAERILAALEGVGVAGARRGVVLRRIDQGATLAGVCFGQQAGDRFGGGKVGVAVVEIAIRKRQVHGLVQGVNVVGAVVTHRLEVEAFQDVQGLQHGRTLHPGGEFVHVDALVAGADRRFDVHLPVGQIGCGEQPAVLAVGAHDFRGDVAAVKALVGRVDGLFARAARGQGLRFRGDEFAQRCQQVALAEQIAAGGRGAALRVGLVQIGQEHAL